ncbi:RING finger protein 37 [Tenebrio molitor]|jgi:hypothetical protein|uniref:RING finger protein 37 n=1 Tax=Tenebrio molitor TaxID=7067 RepID=UPI00362473FC
MYNFLDPKLMPKVSCNAPSTDNYEPTNLISDKEAIRARGYLAYTVTMPPVHLEFEFLCPVNISYISLHTTVGAQKCTGVEVFARSSSNPSYTSIGRAVYNSAGLTFCNSRKYSKTNAPPHHDSTKELFFFKSDTFRIFSDMTFLKIVIFRTERSVPCLAWIKVFGNPSRTCSKTTTDTIDKIMGRGPVQIIQDTTAEKSGLQIPEDFTDDLTCEIMTIPMTLPSGKTVDRDTLEKHIENEKSFGRRPCDPFTGLNFTESRKPVMNIALKSRIDMFLLQNSNNPITFGLKRTLGSEGTKSCKRFKNSDEASSKCCVCSKSEQLYAIPCQHFYCRSCLCLLSSKTPQCNVCKTEFSKCDATCYHN